MNIGDRQSTPKPVKPPAELVEMAIDETYADLGATRPRVIPIDPEFRFRKPLRDGEANWDLNPGVAPLYMLGPFGAAVKRLQGRFDAKR